MIEDFRHACVVVKDLDKALKFYRDIMGLGVFKVRTVEGEYPATVLGVKGIKLTYVKLRARKQAKDRPAVFELHYWQRPRISQRSKYNHISFTIKDIDSEYKRLRKRGVRFISKPVKSPDGSTKICFCFDPDNNLIEFIEDKQRTKRRFSIPSSRLGFFCL